MLAQFREAGRRLSTSCDLPRKCARAGGDDSPSCGIQSRAVNFKLASLREGTEAVRISDEQRQKLMAEWLPAARQEAERLNVTANFLCLRISSARGRTPPPIEDIGCFMGYSYARILVDGTVLYCCSRKW